MVKCTFWYSPEILRTVRMRSETKWSITPDQKRETYELLGFDPSADHPIYSCPLRFTSR